MKKRIMAVNAGPRKGWNTDTLITEASRGAETAGDGGCKWLLRSPGNMWMSAACINADGEPDDRGVFVQDAHCCICPALWIRMQSNEE